MKYLAALVFVLLCTPLICNSYETETHATITAQAYLNSNLVPADKLALVSVKLRAWDSILKR